jgi:hypothetical protein
MRYAACLAALACFALPATAADEKKPNIVLIVADDRDYSEGRARYHTSN